MIQETKTNELLTFFKALSDANRLKIVGLLSQQELSVEQIAEMLGLSPSTISHHLGKLTRVGLVSARPQSYYNLYCLEPKTLEIMSRRLLTKEMLPEMASDVDLDAYDRKVVKNYSYPDGRLKDIPLQMKKLVAILRYVVRDFKFDVEYTEKEVNEILEKYHIDYALLRRELVEFGFMAREDGGGKYWRVKKQD